MKIQLNRLFVFPIILHLLFPASVFAGQSHAIDQATLDRINVLENATKIYDDSKCGEIYVVHDEEIIKSLCANQSAAYQTAIEDATSVDGKENIENKLDVLANHTFVDPSIPQLFTLSGKQHYPIKGKMHWKKFRYKRGRIEKADYQTQEAQVIAAIPQSLAPETKNIKKLASFTDKIVDKILVEELGKRVTARFEKEVRLAEQHQNKTLKKYLKDIKKKLFEDYEKDPKSQIRTFMTLYPDLIQEIKDDSGHDLRPLICKYELAKHHKKIFKRWTHILSASAGALFLAGVIVGSMGTAIPALAIAGSVVAVLVGARDIAFTIHGMGVKEKTGSIAGMLADLAAELKKMQAALEKRQAKLQAVGLDLEDEEKAKLAEIQQLDADISKERRKGLKKMYRNNTHFNRMGIAFGVLNIGFNHLNFYGDPMFLSKLPGRIFSLLK